MTKPPILSEEPVGSCWGSGTFNYIVADAVKLSNPSNSRGFKQVDFDQVKNFKICKGIEIESFKIELTRIPCRFKKRYT